MGWAFAWATAKGAVHADGEVCQDFAACSAVSRGVLVAALADGAGSAQLGAFGAKTSVSAFLCEASAFVERGTSFDVSDLKSLFESTVQSVRREADTLGYEFSKCASTLIGVICEPEATHILQIGDGAAVLRIGDEWSIPIWPVETEFINTTHFITSANANELVQVQAGLPPIDELVMFSDGLQLLVLDSKTREPHLQFFNSVTERFSLSASEENSEMSVWLGEMLRSPGVVSRTDDDTSVLLAKRYERVL